MSINTTSLNGVCPAPSVGVVNAMVFGLMQALTASFSAISSPELWPPDYGDTALQQDLGIYDFVVVGAGTGGSVVASRLSEDPNKRVLVLEAGGDPPQESEVPLFFFPIQHTKYTYNYTSEPTEKVCRAMANALCYLPRGKFIGGTGGINGMVYLRGSRKDYDGWKRLGNYGWGYDDVMPFFRKAERPVGNATHPRGYVILNKFPVEHVESYIEMIYKANAELGKPRVEQFEEGRETGYANVPGTIQNGHRMSTGKVYLGRVSGRSNLHVIKHAQATRINFDPTGKRVISVNFVLRGQQQLEAKVKRELVLSAGTIDTPKLLMLSGVGPREHLENLKIPVRQDLRIGDNLQDHVAVPVMMKLQCDTILPTTQSEILDDIFDYLLKRQGPFSSTGINTLIGFLNTVKDSHSAYADVEFHHTIIRRGDFGAITLWLDTQRVSQHFRESILRTLNNCMILVILPTVSYPKSVGNLRLRSANYQDAPKIFAGYFEEPADVETMLRGIRHIMKLEETKAFKDKGAELIHIPIAECDSRTFKSDDYWRCYMKYLGGTTYHHTGTVKMGNKYDRTACVDPHLRLYGVENLRVADASIMPILTSVNTNAPTIMIGERAADFIKKGL